MRNLRSAGTRRSRARVAAAAALPVLAVWPAGSAGAGPPSAKPATGDSWISQVRWTSRQVAPGVTVRTGVSRSPAEQIREAIINP